MSYLVYNGQMDTLIDFILAKTDEEREAKWEALAKRQVPSDLEVVASFLRDCTTLDGKPITLKSER